MKITFEKNARDEQMRDMIVHHKDGPFVACTLHVDVVGDMGLDNFEGRIGSPEGHYRDVIEAELI